MVQPQGRQEGQCTFLAHLGERLFGGLVDAPDAHEHRLRQPSVRPATISRLSNEAAQNAHRLNIMAPPVEMKLDDDEQSIAARA